MSCHGCSIFKLLFIMSITYRQLKAHEAERIKEIDNTIPIPRVWRKKDGVKQWIEVNWEQDSDFPDGYQNHLAALKETFRNNGFVLGAFENECLVGFCSINRDLFGSKSKYSLLDQLFISNGYRRMGIGKKLFFMCMDKAESWGADKFYICAGSSEDTLNFYVSLGCENAKEINQQLYEQDENDVQLEYDFATKDLEEMSDFFNVRADTYDSHMLSDLNLNSFYEVIAACLDKPINKLLDLGCGTGLELERIFDKYPDIKVTGIDMSSEMLKKLEQKYSDKNLRLICDSYFSVDFGGEYDCVLSTYSFHHFSQEDKLALYKKIHDALKSDGLFVFGDYTVITEEEQQALIEENEKRRKEQNIAEGEFFHFDIPFTADTEMQLMKLAGFASIKLAWQKENASIIVAKKL